MPNSEALFHTAYAGRLRLPGSKACLAIGAKASPLVQMLRYGMQFVDRGAEFYETRHRQREITSLKRKATNLGFQIIETQAA